MKKKPFASFTDEKLILSFARETFLWNQVQAVHLEGRRKLTLVYKEKEKRKKEALELPNSRIVHLVTENNQKLNGRTTLF